MEEQAAARDRLNDAATLLTRLEEARANAPADVYSDWTTTIDGTTYSVETLNQAYNDTETALLQYQQQMSEADNTVREAEEGVSALNETISLFDSVPAAQSLEELNQAQGRYSAKSKEYAKEDAATLQETTSNLLATYQRTKADYEAHAETMDAAQKAHDEQFLTELRANMESAANAVSEGSGTLMAQWVASIDAGKPDVQTAMLLVRDGVITAADASPAAPHCARTACFYASSSSRPLRASSTLPRNRSLSSSLKFFRT